MEDALALLGIDANLMIDNASSPESCDYFYLFYEERLNIDESNADAFHLHSLRMIRDSHFGAKKGVFFSLVERVLMVVLLSFPISLSLRAQSKL